MSEASADKPGGGPRDGSPAGAGGADPLLERVLRQTLEGGEGWSSEARGALAEVVKVHGAQAEMTEQIAVELVRGVVAGVFRVSPGGVGVWGKASEAVARAMWEDPAWHERLGKIWMGLQGGQGG